MKGLSILQLIPAELCVIAATIIHRQSLQSSAGSGWQRHAAASIPAVYTLLLLLLWVLPIQYFLVATLTAAALLPLLGLTLVGVILGASLPNSYFRLRRVEADGRTYAALGVRRFRSTVTYGDPMVRLMRGIDPKSCARLKTSTLTGRENRTKKTERIHWAMLLGTIPTAVWAVMVREYWFAVYLLIANVPMNVYPVLLQRYTRARLAHIRQHAGNRM